MQLLRSVHDSLLTGHFNTSLILFVISYSMLFAIIACNYYSYIQYIVFHAKKSMNNTEEIYSFFV